MVNFPGFELFLIVRNFNLLSADTFSVGLPLSAATIHEEVEALLRYI